MSESPLTKSFFAFLDKFTLELCDHFGVKEEMTISFNPPLIADPCHREEKIEALYMNRKDLATVMRIDCPNGYMNAEGAACIIAYGSDFLDLLASKDLQFSITESY